MQTILIIGGAGYIGSHTAMALQKAGYDVLVMDDLSTGHPEFLRFGRHVSGDIGDRALLDKVFAENDVAAVMHFASFINVGDSVRTPLPYYHNNFCNTLTLLQAMLEHKVNRFIFSSTCAIYGEPEWLPLTEDHPQNPINPYGRTKLAVEWLLEDLARAHDFTYAALRYFNAAGAAPAELNAAIGEWHDPETHLIPLVLQAALDPAKSIKVFGDDYPTPDGTCVRDYIHVCDLADAHALALERLLCGKPSIACNLGNGNGYSVKELIECARKVTGRPIKMEIAPRRPGDPPQLVGDAAKAKNELGWKPKFADLETIIKTAWDWEQKRNGLAI